MLFAFRTATNIFARYQLCSYGNAFAFRVATFLLGILFGMFFWKCFAFKFSTFLLGISLGMFILKCFYVQNCLNLSCCFISYVLLEICLLLELPPSLLELYELYSSGNAFGFRIATILFGTLLGMFFWKCFILQNCHNNSWYFIRYVLLEFFLPLELPHSFLVPHSVCSSGNAFAFRIATIILVTLSVILPWKCFYAQNCHDHSWRFISMFLWEGFCLQNCHNSSCRFIMYVLLKVLLALELS